MGTTHEIKKTEWLLKAHFCRNMADQTTIPDMRAAWLRLAAQCLQIAHPENASTESELAIAGHDHTRPSEAGATPMTTLSGGVCNVLEQRDRR